jgi:pyrroline-5-carboxylate reductase
MSSISIIGTGDMASALAGRALVAHSVKHTNFVLGAGILS